MLGMGALQAISGILLFVVVVLGSVLLGFLLVISPLMIWLNLRRLRCDLHADLAALRASVERLAGTPPGAVATVAAAPREPPREAEPPPQLPTPVEDAIGFSCPACGKFFEGPTSLAGSDYTCPECSVSFHIH